MTFRVVINNANIKDRNPAVIVRTIQAPSAGQAIRLALLWATHDEHTELKHGFYAEVSVVDSGE